MKPAIEKEYAIGIDISKAYFDVAYVKDGVKHHRQFKNTKQGFRNLKKWLRKQKVRTPHFAMEATGRYGLKLASFLHRQGYAVSIVNPRQIKAYRDSWLFRNKSDAADALLIAKFCRSRSLPLWQPPAQELSAIQDMERRITALKKMRTMEKNRLKSGEMAKAVAKSIKKHLAFLDKSIAQMEGEIKELVNQHPALQEIIKLLTSITGIGEKTAIILMGEIRDITLFGSAPALAAYAGVSPQNHNSGDTVRKKPKMSKVGNAHLRGAVYYPALSAMQHNPIVKDFVERLKANGKEGKVLVGAAMRKLLHIVYGVWSSGKPFDPNYEKRSQSLAA